MAENGDSISLGVTELRSGSHGTKQSKLAISDSNAHNHASLPQQHDIPSENAICETCAAASREMDRIQRSAVTGSCGVALSSLRDMLKNHECHSCQAIYRIFRDNLQLHEYTDREMETSEIEISFSPVGISSWEVDIGTLMYEYRMIPLKPAETVLDGPDTYENTMLPFSGTLDVALVREWIRRCDQEHVACKRSAPKRLDLPLFLVDVQEQCLILRTCADAYIALSYVWGQVPITKTTSSNVQELMKPGALRSPRVKIPATVRDTILLTKLLGYRYVWVDCLCIVQDDVNIQQYLNCMDEIYGNALLTIVAAGGSDAQHGLPGVRENSRPVQKPSQMPFHWIPFPHQNYRVRDDWDCPRWDLTPWSERSWTLQEGFFARRTLNFDHVVSWTCPTMYRDECGYNRLNNPNMFDIQEFVPPWLCRGSRRGFDLSEYADTVKAYNTRKLSFDSDVLNAFAGIMSSFAGECEGRSATFLYGIPIQSFLPALMWRRDFNKSSTLVSRDAGNSAGIARLPTWSWTAWRGGLNLDSWRAEHSAEPSHYILKTCKYCRAALALSDSCKCQHVSGPEAPASDPEGPSHPSECHWLEDYSPHLLLRTESARFSMSFSREHYGFVIVGDHQYPSLITMDSRPVSDDLGITEDCPRERLVSSSPYEFLWISQTTYAYGVECYNVLCVERRNGIWYRIGAGEIPKEVWDSNGTRETLDIVLG